MRAGRRAGYIYRMTRRSNEMNTGLLERGCADCALRLKASACPQEQEEDLRADPEDAAERQIERIEQVFGPEWKW
jgi:hypothetical protein